MKIEKKKVNELRLADYNPRTISNEELKKLKKSIQEFGYVEPMVWNKQTGNVVGGNQRLKALKELGIEEVDVTEVDLPLEKEKSLNLALNKISGEWDEKRLAELLEGLDDELTELTGFDEKEVSQLLDSANEGEEDNFDTEKAIKQPKYEVKRGEVWQLGKHKLMCGDATSKEDVDKLMNGQKADMVFTDPPYGVDYSSKNDFLNKADKGNRNQTPIENDHIEDYNEFFGGFMKNLPLKDKNSIYITISDQKLLELLQSAKEKEINMSQLLVWVKNNHILGRQDYSNKHELIFYGWKGSHKYYGEFDTTVWEMNRPTSSKEHPTMKPIELCSRAIKNSSIKEMIVLDLFGGSGSTLIACEQLNRNCYMMELDETYCSVIIERWERMVGQGAKRL